MEPVTVDKCQVLQFNHREICHTYYKLRAEMDTKFDLYGLHCLEMRDDEHV